MSSIEPDDSGGEVHAAKKGASTFVVSGSDASDLLDATEETLGQIAAFVDVLIERARVESVGASLVGHDELGG